MLKNYFLVCASMMSILLTAKETSLNGPWKFKLGEDSATQVQVPHTWNAEDGCAGPKSKRHSALSVQSNSYRRGQALYSRTITIKPQQNKRYFIRCEGASIVSEVKVNNQFVGKHEGAFTAFCYEITDSLKAENNNITISVDNTYNDNILPLSGDFSMFGGLYRNVSIIEKDKTCFAPNFLGTSGIWLQAKDTNQTDQVLDIYALVSQEGLPVTDFSVELIDKNGKKVATQTLENQVHSVTEVFPVKNIATIIPQHCDIQRVVTSKDIKTFSKKILVKNPELWQGRENPALYRVVITLKNNNKVLDAQTINYGFRNFEITKDKGFILNGKAMTLKGVNRHQDKEGKGWALSKQDEDHDMQMIYEMGADALRTAHYPQTKNIYDFCDKNGLLVWSEVSAIEKVRDRPEFLDNMNTQALEMVLQHYNHPSIFIWGLFNEIFHQTNAEDRKHNMIKVLTQLNQTIKSVDQRPTVGNSNSHNKQLNNIGDVFAVNVYPGWYGGGPERMGNFIDSYKNSLPNKPMGIGEYGHGADITDHEYPTKQPRPVSPWHPEEWQAFAHEVNYRHIKVRSALWGTFIWNMFDFATVERIEGAKAGMNDKGLVTYDRKTKKDAYFFYKANWNPEPMLHLVSKRFTERPNQPEKVEVKAYCNAKDVELFVNGEKIGETQQPNDQKIVIWKSVPLQVENNKIMVKAKHNNKILKDTCTWIRKK